MTREEAIDILSIDRLAYNEADADKFCEAYNMAIEALKQEPITVETINQYCKEHNYVLCEKGTEHGKILVCLNCGLDVHSDFKYCPRCGADMRGEV